MSLLSLTDKKQNNNDGKIPGNLLISKFHQLNFKKPMNKIMSSANLNYPYYHNYHSNNKQHY